MMRDVELDRVLRTWLAEGGERAPERDVEAALTRVATIRQARRPWARQVPVMPRWAWIAAAALLVVVVGFAVGVGGGIIRPPWVTSETRTPPTMTDVPLRSLVVEDRASRVSVPASWAEIETRCCDYREFGGTEPEGHLSIGHQSPYTTTICVPECRPIELPWTIPYSATRQIDALKDGVSGILESDAWKAVPPGVLPDLERGARLDTVGQDAAGRSWRRVVIVGLRERNVVAIAWSQPDEVFDPALFDAVLATVELPPAPTYSDGDLTGWDDGGPFTLRVPGHWWTAEQPTLDGVGLSGTYRFGDGAVLVSIGSVDGTLGWCDPACERLTGMTSLEALEAAIRAGRDLGPSAAATLGGEPGVLFGTDVPATRRYALAMHGGRPVAVLVDVGEWEVAPGIPEEIIASLAFRDPATSPPSGTTYTTGDGRIGLTLPEAWQQDSNDDGLFLRRDHRLTVRVGGEDGAITTCDEPAGPWELCREIRATTLDELAGAVQPAPIDDHGVGPPTGRREDITLDGQPAVVTRIQAYEYPARGGQEVAYVVAIHDGRPVILRAWTSKNLLMALDEIIAGLSFVDPGSAAAPEPSASAPSRQTVVVAGGLVEMTIPIRWERTTSDGSSFRMIQPSQSMTLSAGSSDGTIQRCRANEGQPTDCRPVAAATLDALETASRPARVDRRTAVVVDGEPGVLLRWASRGTANPGESALLVVVHDGRPFIVRVSSRRGPIVGLESIIDGFRFLT